MHERADRAAETLMLRFWPELRDATNDHYWTYAHDWDVVLDVMERRGPSAFAGTARMFFDVQDARGWFRDYYDDENWMTLTLIRAWDLTSDPRYLDKAREIFEDVMSAWDTTCCGANKGGIWWRKAHDTKVTAINAGAVVSASRLYERTHEQKYLAFASTAYEHWSTYMVDPATGHVYDGIAATGEINTTWKFTYNEGLMVGAAVALAKASGDPAPLALAHKIGAFMLSQEVAAVPLGTILTEGPCGKPGGDDGEMFKGIAARYLGELFLADPTHDEYRELLVRSADAAWTYARDPDTGLFSCDWAGPYNSNTNSSNSMSSAAIAIAAAARVLGPASQRDPLVVQLEECELRGVGIEATHQGFTGWGYVAGWGNEGQSVECVVFAPKAGDYAASLRYATGDAARRTVSVNGKSTALTFPPTGGYETYGTVSTSFPLAEGENTVRISFEPGDSSYLNLDSVGLSP